MCEVRGGGQEELPHIQGQWQPGGDTPCPRSGQRPGGATPCPKPVAARRKHPASEIRGGGREELSHVLGHGWLGGDTPRPRSETVGKATSHPRPGAVTLRSHPEPEARGGSWKEPPTPEARAGGQEEQPEQRWLPRHRRA